MQRVLVKRFFIYLLGWLIMSGTTNACVAEEIDLCAGNSEWYGLDLDGTPSDISMIEILKEGNLFKVILSLGGEIFYLENAQCEKVDKNIFRFTYPDLNKNMRKTIFEYVPRKRAIRAIESDYHYMKLPVPPLNALFVDHLE